MKKISRLDYCQYLMVRQTNYTLTYYAEQHLEKISHDRINRYLSNDKLQPRLLWEQIKNDKNDYIVFDDTVLDKDHSHKIELVTARKWLEI